MKYEEPMMEIIYFENETFTTGSSSDPDPDPDSYGLLF